MFGKSIPGPIWKSIFDQALAGQAFQDFVAPDPKIIHGIQVRVPDLKGLRPLEAKAALMALGLTPVVSTHPGRRRGHPAQARGEHQPAGRHLRRPGQRGDAEPLEREAAARRQPVPRRLRERLAQRVRLTQRYGLAGDVGLGSRRASRTATSPPGAASPAAEALARRRVTGSGPQGVAHQLGHPGPVGPTGHLRLDDLHDRADRARPVLAGGPDVRHGRVDDRG